MCQLTLTYSKYTNLERILVTILSLRNSKTNQHGWGLLNRAGLVWKTAQAANLTSNAGICVRAMIGAGPNIIHVRAASKGVAVAEVNVHPFEFENLIGIHNGTLWYKDEVVSYTETVRESDSSRFLSQLSDLLSTEKDFIKAIQTIMKDWRGKFAFMILDKRTGIRYVIRGKSATLYITELKDMSKQPIGYVVNTEKDSLEDALPIVNQMFQLESNTEFEHTPPVLLKEETIYKVESKGLVEVGILTENPLYRPVTPTTTTTISQSTMPGFGTPPRGKDRTMKATSKEVQEIYEFMEAEALVVSDMETIWHAIFGHGLLSATAEEITIFVEEIIQRITSSKAVRDYLKQRYFYRISLGFWNDNPHLVYPLGMQQNAKSAVLGALRKAV